MYGWLWRHLPGRTVVKVLESLVLLVGVLALLAFVVFPRVEAALPYNQVTVDGPTSPPASSPSVTPGPTATR